MRIKLDENLGTRGADLFRAAGHDVATVYEQNLTSAHDQQLISACHAESRCLVTLDLDYSNPLLFPPRKYSGIAVLRLPRKPIDADIVAACQTLVIALSQGDISRKLWVVQRGRIREYQPPDPEDEDSDRPAP